MDPNFSGLIDKPSPSGMSMADAQTKQLDIPDYYETNLALLQKHHPHVFQIISKTRPDPFGEIVLSPTGKPNLRFYNQKGETIFLHDQNNPERETAQFLNMVPKDSTGVVTLVGMGLGYTPLALMQERPTVRHFVVFDLKPGIFLQALQVTDLSPILADPRLRLSIGPEPDVDQALSIASRALQLESIHTLKHLTSMAVNPEAYEKVGDKIFACVNEYNVAGATVSVFGKDFMANRFSHLTSIRHHFLLEKLQNEFKDVPAILVAGGPSLDKNIHILKKAKDRAIIIAVDTVLPALLKNGITPDFMTSIDPEDFTHEKFVDVLPQAKNVSLICAAWVSPKVPKIFPGNRVFWTFAGNRIESWLNYLLDGRVLTTGAKTVAHLNFIAATILGCNPMIFVGQDLAFSDQKDHATHTVLTNQNAISDFLKAEKDIILVDGINGGKVPTNRAFYSMKIQFEKMIGGQPGQYINATEGGAHIQGTEVLLLEEALDQYCNIPRNITQYMETFIQHSKPMDMTKLIAEFHNFLRQIGLIRKNIKKSDKITKEIHDKLVKHQKAGTKFSCVTSLPKSMQKQLCEIDACHKEIDTAANIWQLLEELTMEGLRKSERQMHLMTRIQGDPEKYMEWLTAGLKRLESINRVRTKVLSDIETHLSRIITHHEQEKKLSEALHREEQVEQNLMRLARLYYDSGDMVLAEKALKQIGSPTRDIALFYFYLGCVKAYLGEPDQAEKQFETCCQHDESFQKEVNDFRTKFGDDYNRYIQRLKSDGYDIKRMILKGLRHCWDHETINREITTLAVYDLSIIESSMDNRTIREEETRLRNWISDIEQHPNLEKALGCDLVSKFHQYHGHLRVTEGKNQDAAACFQMALALTPKRPELHIFLADSFFAENDFDTAIQHLIQAVELDRSYAVFWENIGDNLHNTGQFENALIAYEQCFIILPEKIELLKKIGDCYQKLDRGPAALTAYQQLQVRMKQHAAEMQLGA